MAAAFLASIAITICTVAAAALLAPDSAYASALAEPDNETLRTRSCLLSWAVPRSHIISRDDPSDASKYVELNWQWSALNGTVFPFMYVSARNELDVAAAVRCGTALGVRVVAKSGGHSYVKHGFGDADSLIIDLQLLNTVNVDSAMATATIGAGARQGKILADLWAAGRWLLPAGNCPTVGLAGFALGGGYGSYARWLGLAADHLLEATMVDATGTIRVVNNITDPDLLWALRGGGGGNYGIVTSMKLRLRPAPSRVLQAVVTYSWDQFHDWLQAWQRWVSMDSPAPSHLVAVVLFNSTKIRTRFLSMDGDRAELESVIDTQFPPPDAVASFDSFTFPELVVNRAQGYWPADAALPLTDISQLANLSRHNAPGWKRVKSLFVDPDGGGKLVTDGAISELKSLFLDFVGRHPEAQVSFEQQGGAIAAGVGAHPGDTAYVHRGRALYGVFLQVFSPGTDAQEPVEAVAAMEHFFQATATESLLNHSSSYQNYLDSNLPGYLRRYYGNNLERLVAVKGRVDPGNVFYHTKSIPVRLP